jgi:hypothetical protein
MAIPTLFTSPKVSTDLTKFGPDHWNRVTALLTGLLGGAEANGSILTKSTGSSTGASWLPDVAAGSILVSGGVGAAPTWSVRPTTLAGYGITDPIVLGTRAVNGHALSADVVVTKGDLGLGAVENTALSTWAGSGNLTTLGPLAGPLLVPAGTALLPAFAFAAEPTLGFWRNGAANVTLQGSLIATGNVQAAGVSITTLTLSGLARVVSGGADGHVSVRNTAQTIGIDFKVDALPTIASGFGTSPSVTAGSTPLAGSVNVGTGGTATSGVINWNGTAFPSAPFPVFSTKLGSLVIVTAISTTQMTLGCTGGVAFVSGDVIAWHCISSK